MRIRARTKPIGVLSAVPAIAAVLALGHGPIVAAKPIEASRAIAGAPSSAPAHAAASRGPRVLCWARNSRATGRLRAKQRPTRCGLVRRRHASKPAVRLIKLRWKRWAATRGHATGMAAGRTSRTRFRVTLRRPVRGCRGRVFSRAVLRNRSRTRRFALRTRCAIGGGQHQKPGGGEPPGGEEQPGGGPCVEENEDLPDDDEDGGPSLSPALEDVAFTLDASLDGIDDDGTLPLDIDAVCGVPADLASEAAKLVQLSGVALLNAGVEIWTCAGTAEEAGSDDGAECSDIPEKGGTLLQGEEATSTLDNDADTAFVGVQLVPRADWRQDEDGEPLPTFDTYWVKITD